MLLLLLLLTILVTSNSIEREETLALLLKNEYHLESLVGMASQLTKDIERWVKLGGIPTGAVGYYMKKAAKASDCQKEVDDVNELKLTYCIYTKTLHKNTTTENEIDFCSFIIKEYPYDQWEGIQGQMRDIISDCVIQRFAVAALYEFLEENASNKPVYLEDLKSLISIVKSFNHFDARISCDWVK